ncbi:hypothetical protein ACS0TY_012892 [Phlomoides rotata]
MAAAYAALVSFFNNLDQIHNHPRFSASFDPYQTESLRAHIDFFLDFVERYNIDGGMSRGVQELRSQIVRAAHEAEDITESHIVNQILPESAEISDVRLHHRCLFGLQKVIQDMDSIKDKVLKIKEEESGFNYQKPPNSTPPTTTEQNRMVGFENELMQLKDVLIGQQSSRQIISIVGMGGTGKTTLAKYVYQDSLTMHHFDQRAWATISQEYDVRDIFLQLLSVAEGTLDDLRDRLYKKLFGRRYLIILDDVWSTEVWDSIRPFFPDNGDGSRIILTTRLSNMAPQLCSICIRINFLDENESWNLFCQKIFGQEDCPVELEGIGKKIAKQCKGLPLSIVVIGGLLKKSHRTEEYWPLTKT